jgi:hypothetical protein
MTTRRVENAFVGARGTDSVQAIDAAHAQALKTWGMDFAIRYLGSVTSSEIDAILDAGLAFMPVTYGLKHGTPLHQALGLMYGDRSVKQAQALGIPKGTTVWLDLEDCTGTAKEISSFVNSWSSVVSGAGFMPGLYVGAGAVLSSAELYALSVVRYWQSLSKEVDARGQIAEPGCGWCMIQLFPSVTVAGVFVDVDVVQQDYRNRTPAWVRGV